PWPGRSRRTRSGSAGPRRDARASCGHVAPFPISLLAAAWLRGRARGSLRLSAGEVLNVHVRARKHLGLVAILPPNHVGRCSLLTQDLENLSVPRELALMVATNDQAI